MTKQPSRIRNYLEYFFLIFILIQPFLDISAFLGLMLSDAVRVLAMAAGFVYVLLHPNKKIKNVASLYIVVLAIFMLGNLANNFLVDENFNLMRNLTYNIKSAFVAEMLVIYALVFLSIKKRMDWQTIVQRNITISLTIIGIVMVIASLTGTGKRSYGFLQKEGHSGWFFSGNELGAILAMGLGIMILYMLNKKAPKRKLLLLPGIIMGAWSMYMLGTKVGIIAALALLGFGVAIAIIEFFMKRRKFIDTILLGIVFLAAIAYIPFSPVVHNMGLDLYDEHESNLEKFENPDQEQVPLPEEEPTVEQKERNALLYRIFSGRTDFLIYTAVHYDAAPVSQKLLGMGPALIYLNGQPKLIEMDFFDWFFGYGIIGFLLLMAPIVYMAFVIIKQLFQQRFRALLSRNYWMVAIEVGLGVGIAFIAGHIFLNPASGIYFSILLSYLYVLSLQPADKLQEQ
ncbi:O-antigen ligase family protein [Oceanobacillus senegalensis]|uniref:O-antigen ligase family protein n=1 Tax=Oceanobacillus senegalensis TaxID=1936063 RepID=UPI00117BFDBF|nr:O-antigen ligase family protein [Oceanobacillus senegalensis]